MGAKRLLRSAAFGAAAQIVVMYLANAGKLGDSLQWIFTPVLYIASVLRIGAHDGGIIVVWLLLGIVEFGAVAFALDVLLTFMTGIGARRRV